MTETLVAVDGGEVWADDTGGAGRPLVLLHPGVGDSRIWDGLLPALTPKYRVIRYDARGFGRSPAPSVKFSLLRDLVAVLDHFGVERAAFVGCSQGGGSTLGLVIGEPSWVSALVLLCPGVPGAPALEEAKNTPGEEELEAALDRAIEAGDVDGVAGVMQRIWGKSGATPQVMEQLRSAARAALSGGELKEEAAPVFGRLGEITVPSALLVGDADYPPLVEANKQAAAVIPGCAFTLVPGMDHFPPLREPDLVMETITRTLDRRGLVTGDILPTQNDRPAWGR
jgi:pimeloyl-ACP methyl ester carboxylesterase